MWTDEAALDAAERRLDQWESGLAERAEQAKSLSARVQALTGTATSTDRAVTVTVDATGGLLDLRLDERVRQHSAAHTARLILEITRAARADLLRQVTEATAGTLDRDDPTGQAIVESYRSRLRPDPGEAHA
ncbi:YbaB/EbfC family nucleoid-associated protein [Micromonospora purpureochromogenes]|uniref:DNA-binding protein YbaB n=1 Tax=Micromonospora purpureochromogenes TaxID=47872 RepID=A0ABX2RVQ1_9ACTN|nr:YbaB/EbfC family nucleoid-associated protein [Micromonospora purpureochromogenes]NYF59339.1 DNA-binding protein YbaB [Micromonospora purpureochromogenes]